MFEHSRDTFYVSDGISFSNLRFENDVEMYGAQTVSFVPAWIAEFENDVEMYGAQTGSDLLFQIFEFENDVEMYGAQTMKLLSFDSLCLRMM